MILFRVSRVSQPVSSYNELIETIFYRASNYSGYMYLNLDFSISCFSC